MQRRFGGGGDFAYAYVIAHEVGHHVENLLGILPKVQQAQRRAGDRAEANNLSVRVELMADCLAGVWANKMNQRRSNIDENDVEQAVAAATAIGDDRLQRQSQGCVGAGQLHPRLVRAARALADDRPEERRRSDSCNTFQTAASLTAAIPEARVIPTVDAHRAPPVCTLGASGALTSALGGRDRAPGSGAAVAEQIAAVARWPASPVRASAAHRARAEAAPRGPSSHCATKSDASSIQPPAGASPGSMTKLQARRAGPRRRPAASALPPVAWTSPHPAASATMAGNSAARGAMPGSRRARRPRPRPARGPRSCRAERALRPSAGISTVSMADP